MRDFVITAEAVTRGHPDKLCDQISDAIIDGYLAADLRSGVAADCALTPGALFVSLRAGAEPPMDVAALARAVMADAGYDTQTPDVFLDVTLSRDLVPRVKPPRAGHMVTAFGYACAQTPNRMPLAVCLTHELSRAIDRARDNGRLPWIAPDAQVQVALRHHDRQPCAVLAIAIRHATLTQIDDGDARAALGAEVIAPVFARTSLPLGADTRIVTQCAPFAAGPNGHSGLTGRKSSEDFYGSFIRRAGPALSGKDPSRIDRVANYAARHCARSLVAAGLAQEAEVRLTYLIGDPGPAWVEVETHGSGELGDDELARRLQNRVDLRVGAIAETMGLWDLPRLRGGRFYRDLATYGHMGRDALSPPWESEHLGHALAE